MKVCVDFTWIHVLHKYNMDMDEHLKGRVFLRLLLRSLSQPVLRDEDKLTWEASDDNW